MKKFVTLVVVLLALAIPLSASAQGGITYTAGFQLQNLSATPATVLIDFYDQAGNQPTGSSVQDTIPANGSKTYFPLNSVPAGFNGSAVVSSDQALASITNILGNNSQRGDSYGGFVAGAQTVNLPLIMKGNFGYNTWFNVQNTGTTDANVVVTYKPGTCTETKTVKPNASQTFDQSATSCLAAGFVGAATVTSNTPVAVVVMEVGATNLLAYGGFADASTNPIMPLVSSNYYKSGTGIQIQNTGAQASSVTISFTPSNGFPGNACSETHNVPAGESVTFGYTNSQLPAGCGGQGTGVSDTVNGGFVGSAAVTANSTSMPLVAIVNQVNRGGANASSYNAINPASATNKVSLPLIMDRNFGYFTGFSIVNVGAQATNINCTFTGSAVTVSANGVAPGAALTSVQENQLANGYVGSANCTATGGDAKIAGIVNELRGGQPTTTDAQFTYPGFSF